MDTVRSGPPRGSSRPNGARHGAVAPVTTAIILTVEAHEAIRRSTRLVGAALFALAAAAVLVDEAKIERIEYELLLHPAG